MRNLYLASAAMLALAVPATAQFAENFDSYASNSVLNNVGGWFGWDNAPINAGSTSNAFARSAPNSLLSHPDTGVITPNGDYTDAVHPGIGITSGSWQLTAWQYIPAPLNGGGVWFILNNAYTHGGFKSWCLQLNCSGTSISDVDRTGSQPLVFNQWVEVRINFDLDANTMSCYYNGGLVSRGVFNVLGGPVALENIDLFSNAPGVGAGGTCYWDDIEIKRRGPRDIATLDANGDGRPDLATANGTTNDVSLYVNSGTGTFGADTWVAVGPADSGLVALTGGDLDGDGVGDDLAVACSTSSTVCTIVNPNGTPVRTSMAIPGLSNPVDVAIARLDAGATGDLAVACQGTLFVSGGIAVSMNGGAFATVATGSFVKVVLGDLDGDGDNDLAAIQRGAPDRIALFANNGSGSFTPAGAINLSTTNFASGLALGNVDGFNGNDLVSLTPNPFVPSNTLNVHKNTGVGALGPARFTTPAAINTPGVLAADVAIGDFEQDTVVAGGTTLLARQDILVTNAGIGAPQSHHGFTGSTFLSTQTRTAGVNPIACVIADFNGDGQDDWAVANQGSGGITVSVTAPTPLADPYGTGCPGTGGLTPIIGHTGGNPTSGSTTFAVSLAQGKSLALAGLLLSFGVDNAPLGGCTIYIQPPASTFGFVFTDGVGSASSPFAIPAAPVFQGTDIFMQWAVFDPAGTFASILAFSSGLHVQIGQ